jgi:hypothetical protein
MHPGGLCAAMSAKLNRALEYAQVVHYSLTYIQILVKLEQRDIA